MKYVFLSIVSFPGIDFMAFGCKEYQIKETRNSYPVANAQIIYFSKITVYQW